MEETTEDSLLDGRIRLTQPRRGLRAGLDAVLLAAAIAVKPGETLLEAGCGAGAVFLCVMARIPDLRVVAVERDPALAELARRNAAANGVADRVQVITGDIAGTILPRCDAACANPPWWPGGTPPPEARRAAATHLSDAGLSAWTHPLAGAVRHQGRVTLILPAALWPEGAQALREAHCGSLAALPLWPRAGEQAGRVLLQGRRGGKGPARLLPGLVLHQDGGWSPAADGVLRRGEALVI